MRFRVWKEEKKKNIKQNVGFLYIDSKIGED